MDWAGNGRDFDFSHQSSVHSSVPPKIFTPTPTLAQHAALLRVARTQICGGPPPWAWLRRLGEAPSSAPRRESTRVKRATRWDGAAMASSPPSSSPAPAELAAPSPCRSARLPSHSSRQTRCGTRGSINASSISPVWAEPSNQPLCLPSPKRPVLASLRRMKTTPPVALVFSHTRRHAASQPPPSSCGRCVGVRVVAKLVRWAVIVALDLLRPLAPRLDHVRRRDEIDGRAFEPPPTPISHCCSGGVPSGLPGQHVPGQHIKHDSSTSGTVAAPLRSLTWLSWSAPRRWKCRELEPASVWWRRRLRSTDARSCPWAPRAVLPRDGTCVPVPAGAPPSQASRGAIEAHRLSLRAPCRASGAGRVEAAAGAVPAEVAEAT